MAKRSLSKELLQETKPQAVYAAAVGAFLSFFVYIGVVVTTEPFVATLIGSDSYVLAQVRGEDGDLREATQQAEWGQRQLEAQRNFDRMQRDMTRDDTNKYSNPNYKPRHGETWYQNGTVYTYVVGSNGRGKWVCTFNCKPTGPEKRTQ